MKINRRAEKKRTNRLDAYIDQVLRSKSGEMPPPSQSPDAMAAAVLHDEAEGIQPDPDFVARLSVHLRARHQNSVSTSPQVQKPRRTMLMARFSWCMTVAATVLVTLIIVALIKPQTLPADRILAYAAEVTQRRPGTVEHLVIENHLLSLIDTAPSATIGYVIEDWKRFGEALDGYLTVSEHTVARSPDLNTTQPLSWAYESWSKTCFLDLTDYPVIVRDLGTDSEGCLSMDQAVRISIPSPIARYAEASPQTWINRFQQKAEALAYQTDTFEGQRVYSLQELHDDVTLTLYVDRRTYQPVGFTAQTSDYVLTQIVHHYEIVHPEALPFDPFAWPPVSLQGAGFQTALRSDQ